MPFNGCQTFVHEGSKVPREVCGVVNIEEY